MQYLTVFLLIVCLALSPAVAQPGAEPPTDAPTEVPAEVPTEVPLDVFLEQRVAEELAADGTILSRLGVALDIELVGPKVLVRLVDPATRRAVASTDVDAIPVDREAAVASVTQVAANLAAQVSVRATPEATAVSAALAEDRRLREERAAAEARFRQEAISFGDDTVVSGGGWSGTWFVSTQRNWVAYRGEERLRLSPVEFYRYVGRSDLAEAYNRRKRSGVYLMVAGGLTLLAGMAVTLVPEFMTFEDPNTCPPDDPFDPFDNCYYVGPDVHELRDRQRATYRPIGLGVMTLGGVVAVIGAFRFGRANPVGEREAQELGRAHNRKLRQKYGLPVAVSPYVDASGGGLSVAGRF